MKVLEAGRLVVPAGEPAARRWAEEHLLSLHRRRARLLAAAGWVRLSGAVREIEADGPAALLGLPEEVLATAPVAAGAPWVLLGGYRPAERRAVLVLLDPTTGAAAAVVKVRPPSEPALAREAALLDALAPALPPELAATLPRPLLRISTPRHEVLVLAAVPGRPLSLALQRSLRPLAAHVGHLEAAGRWLARLHRATASDGEVAVHGDPWPRNLLFTAGVLTGVVDWEAGGLRGGPEEDLFALPLLLAAELPRWRGSGARTEGDAFAAAFLADGAVARAVGRFLDAYRAERGLGKQHMRGWLERFIDAAEERSGREDHGWRTRFPWPALRARLAARRDAWCG